ncbi:MAG TPA: hypothetical protein DIS84_10985 [Corynebacterium stationis]|nr:hypothetical protein [Corynebacterium stationis]
MTHGAVAEMGAKTAPVMRGAKKVAVEKAAGHLRMPHGTGRLRTGIITQRNHHVHAVPANGNESVLEKHVRARATPVKRMGQPKGHKKHAQCRHRRQLRRRFSRSSR